MSESQDVNCLVSLHTNFLFSDDIMKNDMLNMAK